MNIKKKEDKYYQRYGPFPSGGGLSSGGGGLLPVPTPVGDGTPGPPVNSIQFNHPLGEFDGDGNYIITPGSSPNVTLKAASGGDEVLSIQDITASGTTDVGSFPALAMLEVSDDTVYYALGFANNSSSRTWGVFINNTTADGQLVWQSYTGTTPKGINTFLQDGGFSAYSVDGLGLYFSKITPLHADSRRGVIYDDGVDSFVLGTTDNSTNLGTPIPVLSWKNGGVTLGKANSVAGKLTFASSGDTDTQSFQAADNPASTLTFKWPAANPSADQVLKASAPSAGVVALDWITPAGTLIGAGDGLSQSGSDFNVNVDDTTIEIVADTLQVKDAGITPDKLSSDLKEVTINVVLNAIEVNQKVRLRVGFNCTITGVSILADTSGDLVLDIWKDTHANAPPDNSDSITAAAQPTLSSAQKMEDTTLTGWTTSINAGDWLIVNVDSVTTITEATLAIEVNRT